MGEAAPVPERELTELEGLQLKCNQVPQKNLLSKPLALWILNCDCVSLDILLKEVVLNTLFIFLTLDAEFLASFCHHNSQFHSLPSVIINILPSTFSIAIARHWDGELENIQNTFEQIPKWWRHRIVCYMFKILPATKAWKLKGDRRVPGINTTDDGLVRGGQGCGNQDACCLRWPGVQTKPMTFDFVLCMQSKTKKLWM